MTLEQLRIFVAVAGRLHLTKAARSLNITQSAASAAVAALERRHGVRLFDRVGRGLALSVAGRAFLPEAEAVLARAANAIAALDDLAGLKRGMVTIAASQTVSNYWLPVRMARFAAAYPGIRLGLRAGNSAQVGQAIAEGSAELGFVEGEIPGAELQRVAVGGDRLLLYAAPDHPGVGRSLAPRDLLAFDWILRESGSGTRSEFELALATRGLDPAQLRILLELPSNEAVLAAVVSGAGVAALSELAAAPRVAAGQLQSLEFPLTQRAFTLVTHRERRRSHAAAAFVAALEEPGGQAVI